LKSISWDSPFNEQTILCKSLFCTGRPLVGNMYSKLSSSFTAGDKLRCRLHRWKVIPDVGDSLDQFVSCDKDTQRKDPKIWHSGTTLGCNAEDRRIGPAYLFWFLIIGILRKISKIVGKLWPSGCLLRSGRMENRRKIPLISKYSVIIVGTRQINLIWMSKWFSVPLILEYCVIRSSWRSFPSTLFTVQKEFVEKFSPASTYLKLWIVCILYIRMCWGRLQNDGMNGHWPGEEGTPIHEKKLKSKITRHRNRKIKHFFTALCIRYLLAVLLNCQQSSLKRAHCVSERWQMYDVHLYTLLNRTKQVWSHLKAGPELLYAIHQTIFNHFSNVYCQV
jgi:hypothetical protein